MKLRLIIFALLAFSPVISFAHYAGGQTESDTDSIHFRDVSLEEGLKMAQAEKKPVFFMCFASWCEHCNRMKEIIFKDAPVAAYYNKHFVCLKHDMEKGDGIALHKRFQVKRYPTFVFLDGDGTTLYQAVDEKNDSMMIDLGKKALTPALQFPYLKAQFEADITNSDKCYTYVFALRTALLDCEQPAMRHLATQTDKQLLTEVNWRIIANGVRDINSREFQFVLSHQGEYSKIASPLRVERKNVNIADETLSPYVTMKDSAGYFSRRPSAEAMRHYKVDSMLFNYDLSIYQSLGNWKEYERVAVKSGCAYAWRNASLLKDIGTNFLTHVSDSASLVQATQFVMRAIEMDDEYPSYMLCAKLYQKAGNKEEAIKMAQKGKDWAAKYGWQHKDADDLLEALKK